MPSAKFVADARRIVAGEDMGPLLRGVRPDEGNDEAKHDGSIGIESEKKRRTGIKMIVRRSKLLFCSPEARSSTRTTISVSVCLKSMYPAGQADGRLFSTETYETTNVPEVDDDNDEKAPTGPM